jgi:two-component system response regulator YesN
MINLLIADDEPLVQAGIKSMLNWKEFNINILGTAMNGAIAYEIIKEQSPEIVIVDIKMPVMNGLELIKKCTTEGRTLPVFVILTSYEDFNFAKEALSYQVIDYLVKLELTEEVLSNVLKKALAKVSQVRKSENVLDNSVISINILKEQFYTRLILNLFESEHQFRLQAHNLKMNFEHSSFEACYVEIYSEKLNDMPEEKQLNLYTSSLQIIQELTAKYVPCHVLSLDMKHFAIIFFLEVGKEKEYKSIINNALVQVSSMLFNYYSVTLLASVGSSVSNPMQIASSFQDAKQIFSQIRPKQPIIFLEDIIVNKDYKNHIVINVKKYIKDHAEEKLTLNKVADVFNISPNYLSVLFSKYNNIGFTDYINKCKIDAAIKLMTDSNLKIYEISEILGFESAFYFSRVFKKVIGVSPRDFINQNG